MSIRFVALALLLLASVAHAQPSLNLLAITAAPSAPAVAGAAPERSPTLAAPRPALVAPAQARAVATRDYGVVLDESDRAFDALELQELARVLALMPARMTGPLPRRTKDGRLVMAPMNLKRVDSLLDADGTTQCFGAYSPAEPWPVKISGRYAREPHRDFPKPPFSDDEGRRAMFGSTIAHELAHRLVSCDADGRYLADKADRPLTAKWIRRFGWKASSNAAWVCSRPERCVTPYAATDPEEDLAETVCMYLYWPAKVKAVAPEKYRFCRDVLGLRESSDRHPYPR